MMKVRGHSQMALKANENKIQKEKEDFSKVLGSSREFNKILVRLKESSSPDAHQLTEEEKKRSEIEALREASNQFEAIVISNYYKPALDSSATKGYIEDGPGTKMFKSMQQDMWLQDLSNQERLGFGKFLFDQLVKSIK